MELRAHPAASLITFFGVFLGLALLGLTVSPASDAVADVASPCPFARSEDAIQGCTETLESPQLRPEDKPFALWERGWAYYHALRDEEALADFDAAIKLIPSESPIESLETAASALLGPSVGPAEQEERDRNRDLVHPFGDFYVGEAAALTALGRFKEAIRATEHGESAFKSKRMVGHARTFRAIAYEGLADWENAERLYREAADLDPESSGEALYDLALMDLKLEKTQDVATILKEATQRDQHFRKAALLSYALNLSKPEKTDELLPDHRLGSFGYSDWDVAIAAYFAEMIGADELAQRPNEADDIAYADWLCEVHFFLAVQSMVVDKSKAIDHFRSAVATSADHSAEYSASQAILSNLTKN